MAVWIAVSEGVQEARRRGRRKSQILFLGMG
jgi:hypothetical protein